MQHGVDTLDYPGNRGKQARTTHRTPAGIMTKYWSKRDQWVHHKEIMETRGKIDFFYRKQINSPQSVRGVYFYGQCERWPTQHQEYHT